VEAVAVPRESWITDFFEQGTPEERSEPRIEMLDAFNSGWIDFGVPGTEHISGVTKLRTVLQALVARP